MGMFYFTGNRQNLVPMTDRFIAITHNFLPMSPSSNVEDIAPIASNLLSGLEKKNCHSPTKPCLKRLLSIPVTKPVLEPTKYNTIEF